MPSETEPAQPGKTRRVQREWAEQKVDARFLNHALPLDAYWTGIDHAGKMSKAAGAQRKARGIKAGIPDFLIVWQGITLWIERKAGSGLSVEQEQTRDALILHGHHWRLARSTEDVEAACRDVGIPLRATCQDTRVEPSVKPKKSGGTRKAEPRFQWGKRAVGRARRAGVLF